MSDESESSDKEYEFNEGENADLSHTLQEVKKNNQLLTKRISHMKKTERRVEAIEDKLEVSVSSSSSTLTRSRKKAVPIEIRVRSYFVLNVVHRVSTRSHVSTQHLFLVFYGLRGSCV